VGNCQQPRKGLIHMSWGLHHEHGWWDTCEKCDSQKGGGFSSRLWSQDNERGVHVEMREGISWKVLAISREMIQSSGQDTGLWVQKCCCKWKFCRYILHWSLQKQHGCRLKSAKNESGTESICDGSWQSIKCVHINLHRSVVVATMFHWAHPIKGTTTASRLS